VADRVGVRMVRRMAEGRRGGHDRPGIDGRTGAPGEGGAVTPPDGDHCYQCNRELVSPSIFQCADCESAERARAIAVRRSAMLELPHIAAFSAAAIGLCVWGPSAWVRLLALLAYMVASARLRALVKVLRKVGVPPPPIPRG